MIDVATRLLTENGSMPSRGFAAALKTSQSTAMRILKDDLQLRPYKIQLTQNLEPADPEKRLQFGKDMLEKFTSYRNIIFSDEAHFYLNGVVNKQNCRIWAMENPRETISKPLHPKKATVWVGLASWGIVGPHFVEDEEGKTTTVNQPQFKYVLPAGRSVHEDDGALRIDRG